MVIKHQMLCCHHDHVKFFVLYVVQLGGQMTNLMHAHMNQIDIPTVLLSSLVQIKSMLLGRVRWQLGKVRWLLESKFQTAGTGEYERK